MLDLQSKITIPSQSQSSHSGQHAHSPEAMFDGAAVSPRNAKSHTSTPMASGHLAAGLTGHSTNSGNIPQGTSTGSVLPSVVAVVDGKAPTTTTVSIMPMSINQAGAFNLDRKVHFDVQPTSKEAVSTWQVSDSGPRAADDSKIPPNSVNLAYPSHLTLGYKETLSGPSGFLGTLNHRGHTDSESSSDTQTTQGAHLLEAPHFMPYYAHPVGGVLPLPPAEYALRPPPLSLALQLPSLSTFQSSIVRGSDPQQLGAVHYSQKDNSATEVSFCSNDASATVDSDGARHVGSTTATPMHPSIVTHSRALAESSTSTPTYTSGRDVSRLPKEYVQSPLPIFTPSKTSYPLSPPDLSMSVSSVLPEKQGTTDSQTLPTLHDLQVSMEKMSLMAKSVLQDIQKEKDALSKHQQKASPDPGAVANARTLHQQSGAQASWFPSAVTGKTTATAPHPTPSSDKVCSMLC